MFAKRLTKAEEKEIFFFEPCLSCFLLFFILPLLLPKSSGFLRLIRSLHNAKFVPFYLVFKVE